MNMMVPVVAWNLVREGLVPTSVQLQPLDLPSAACSLHHCPHLTTADTEVWTQQNLEFHIS